MSLVHATSLVVEEQRTGGAAHLLIVRDTPFSTFRRRTRTHGRAAIVGDKALDAREHDARARRVDAAAMRRAQDCDWTIVARGELGGSVVRLAEAVIQSPPATEHGARDRLPARHGVAWAPGLTPDHTRELVAVSNARATLPRGAFAIRSQSISELTA